MNEKKILTINELKKTNNSIKYALLVFIILTIISFFVFKYVFTIFFEKEYKEILNIFNKLFMLLVIIEFIMFLVSVYKVYRKNLLLEKREFKIVEDKVYDKVVKRTKNRTKSYYLYTKIYGKIFINMAQYVSCNKNDSIYMLFYKGNEKNNNINNLNEKKEFNRNCKIIVQKYISSLYALDSELLLNFIPYDENIGNNNYNNRINNKIVKLSKYKKTLTCDKCNYRFSGNLNSCFCPNCGDIYIIKEKDIMNYKEWYEKD